MPKKLADDLMHTNEEYTKLKSSRPDDVTPRETPGNQAPGRRHLDRPELDTWTTNELREAATELNIHNATTLERAELIDSLVHAEQSR